MEISNPVPEAFTYRDFIASGLLVLALIAIWWVRRLKNRDVAAEVGEKIEKLEKRAFTAIEKQRSDIKQIFEELGTLKVLVGRLDERSQSGGRGH